MRRTVSTDAAPAAAGADSQATETDPSDGNAVGVEVDAVATR